MKLIQAGAWAVIVAAITVPMSMMVAWDLLGLAMRGLRYRWKWRKAGKHLRCWLRREGNSH